MGLDFMDDDCDIEGFPLEDSTSEKTIESSSPKDIPVCRRCGRKLKSAKSRELGMGMTCWKKSILGHKKLFTIPEK